MTDLVRRWGLILVTLGLAGGGLLLPGAPVGSVPPPAEPEPDNYVVCPAAEAGGGFTTRLGLAGPADVRLTAIGAVSGPRDLAVEFGTAQIAVEDLAELGVTPILVEGTVTAATYTRAGEAAGLAGCAPASPEVVAVGGLATSGGQGSTLVLANPFAAEASIRLEAASEFGPDTPADLEEVRVPPFTVVELVLDQLLAGRESLSFSIVTERGLIAAGMRRTAPNDLAVAEAVPARTQWFLGLPDFGFTGEAHIRSLAAVDTAYRVDAVSPEGLVEGVAEGVVGPQGQVVLAVDQLTEAGTGLVIASAEPIVVTLVHSSEDAIAVTPGADREAARWVVPVSAVPAEGQTAMWILNTAGSPLAAVVEPIGSGRSQHLELAPAATTGAIVPNPDGAAILVEAAGPVVVFYGVLTGSAIAMSVAVPLE
ncbi:MAG TPA: DUF5719 family protein [Acidimicrobiia bacterium]|nr:DUF5719 family protein [Acidimicrobiia bacterium]